MPVSLQVSKIRDQILMAAGGPSRSGTGHANRLTGVLFHEVFGDLFGNQPSLHARTALANVGPHPEQWSSALREHAYRLLLGPRLQANHAVLQSATTEVIALWTAVQALTEWSADLLHRAWRNQSAAGASAADIASIIVAEQAVVWSLCEPGWTDSVVISGITDAICRAPETDAWCVVEFKTGSSAPEADLTQACLYHQMLSAIHGSQGSLALVYFTPKIAQQVFKPKQLEEAQARLKELIGRLAGVLPASPPKFVTVAPSPATESSGPRPRHLLEPLHLELGGKVLGVFREYNAPVESAGDPIIGPTFLRFPVRPARGVRPEAVRKLGSALQVRLNLSRQPFVHSTGGRMVVDVERADRQTVLFSSLCDQLPLADPVAGCSKIPVGVDLEGQLRFADLADSADCHLLVAGTTGSGKTEWLRTAVAGLLMTNTAETLQLILIDPKRSAFNELSGSNFLWGDGRVLYPDEVSPVDTFDGLVEEMERRYKLFQQSGVDNLRQYHQQGRMLARIVCVCEEYPDLLFYGRKDIEARIQRLGQKARGAGIHLVLAVQQPSRDIVKGTLQANIPARVGLRVNSPIESRMLLHRAGAEELLGNGDLLFKDIGEPVRLQAPFLPAEERRRLFGKSG
jgi:S-DNA-T family DNA segregation ATPase FtsK/SpoIIIE